MLIAPQVLAAEVLEQPFVPCLPHPLIGAQLLQPSARCREAEDAAQVAEVHHIQPLISAELFARVSHSADTLHIETKAFVLRLTAGVITDRVVVGQHVAASGAVAGAARLCLVVSTAVRVFLLIGVFITLPINVIIIIPINVITILPINTIITLPINTIITLPINMITTLPINMITTLPINTIITERTCVRLARHPITTTPLSHDRLVTHETRTQLCGRSRTHSALRLLRHPRQLLETAGTEVHAPAPAAQTQ